MKTVKLGLSDLHVGEIAYGCWRMSQSTPREAQEKIEAALGCGMNLIDTADIYGFSEPSKYTDQPNGFGEAEAVMGQMFKTAKQLRDQMVLVTKGGITPPRPYDSTHSYLTGALERSLKRLHTDHVELYLIHRPDLTTSFAQAGHALDDLVASGKTRYVGVSNFTPSQFAALQAQMDTKLICHQPEFSISEQSPITDGILDQCQERNLACMAWSPLAGGDIPTGKSSLEIMAVIDRLAQAYEATRTQIALAFVLAHPANTLPIIGTQKIDRIEEAAGASHITLSARDWYDLVEAYRGVGMP